MSAGNKIDKDYKEAFNLGYDLVKELGLKSPLLKDLDSGNDRMKAMHAGMVQYFDEIGQSQGKKIIRPLGLDSGKISDRDAGSKKDNSKDKGKGLDLSI